MERVSFNYSTKNIPVASKKEHIRQLIDKTEQFLCRMRWKAYHFLNPYEQPEKETFGFKTRNSPPVIEELKEFEDGLTKIIQKVKFKNIECQFQKDLNEDIKSIQSDNRLFVKADKSTNFYKLEATKYNQLLHDNITKTYKKAENNQLRKIDDKAKTITEKLRIDDRVETTATKEAFITLKDHKDNFDNKPTCRLINPSKQEIGKISKQILDNINKKLLNVTKVNQWKNTSSVLQWFKHLPNKHRCAFITFDVVEFYPSISETLLTRALDFAANYVNISDDDRHIILQAKQSLLFNNGNPWQKRNTDTLFDVTMGSYDGAETCELVGIYMLSQLKEIPYGMEIGLYRDDGLAVIDQTPQKIEKIKKEICKVFAKNNLRITIEANKKVVNFLDVTLDLTTEKYKPYSKPTNTPLYVHSKSNHPPCIIKNIPEAINKRLSEISSDEEAFKEAAPPYQEALQKSGYSHTLRFTPPQQPPESNTNKRKRQRNIIWFNPPYSKNVQTNIGREFLNLIEKCFPPNHKLRKLFNKNNLKLSYSCSPNIKQIIDGHNKTILSQNKAPEEKTPPKPCNCREPDKCPLKGQCLVKEVVYQATITTAESSETYVGLTATEFKTRWRNHQMSFKHESKKNDTELSKHLWQLKDQKKDFAISWKILAKAKSYSNLTKRCNLCNTEKFYILYKPDMATLNKRNELVSTCRHKRKFLLKFNRILNNQS